MHLWKCKVYEKDIYKRCILNASFKVILVFGFGMIFSFLSLQYEDINCTDNIINDYNNLIKYMVFPIPYWDWRWHWFRGPARLVSVKLIFGRLSFFRFNEWALNLYNYSMSFTRSYEGKATI